ncbi:MAG: NAD-dependent epimerase/dehydratase family protein [Paraburkholderia tropica]|uniref:Nucleoside-diphosphate-sugar epimerase n=1 Tax=Paraburkholderia tropica TaxID=92647 RepID=A0ABX5MFA8_9BURK|nr:MULTISPECIES: NAD-dependent epimerase/dehydratase family protein [Paraburkholderia]MDE1142838.1 NAD-dependent epimerase/dehydratase family protein [Paraburkholderia tropica]PXX07512.1 nucleoside-diphosphate-sugar epimerase [Paraburkholderia tropica]PZW72867.1 nucleoside-diphosphate-sugar epimerase [Paraburkholderia tropica]QNB11727.1 NAD-dependent epimerase/dehydratase family protein [Paraburkholderia tropica]RQM49274.1 NAD-dependent epimerase/dehydratase family protein [Paraburkholderia ba
MKVFVTGAGGFIGGTIAAHLARAGHEVRGLVRRPEQFADLEALNIAPVRGGLDDRDLLMHEARAADAVINAADSDHRGAVEALLDALEGSGKPLLHTSGSSIVGDASGGEPTDKIYYEDALPAPTPDKAPRVAIDDLVLAGAQRGIRSAVLCNTLIYGVGAVPGAASVQLPRLIRQAQKSGVMRHVGRGLNIWSNVHVDDVAELYRLAIEKTPAGTFYFVDSGEANFVSMTEALARKMGLGAPQDWPLKDAIDEWGYEMASYGLGSNSRVRGERARTLLGWQPKRNSVTDWIRDEMPVPASGK